MGVVVLKFGGRLLESPIKIQRAAGYVIQTRLNGDDPIVVVSAPGRATDHLIRWAGKVSAHPEGRELDMLISVGERMAMSLLALAINSDGRFKAISFTGSQVGIITDTRHTDASIVEVKGFRIREAVANGQIPIIAGFQGISTEKEITTLGRGGSDATAVALAAALGAIRCELIKETGGIFSADPLIVETARLHPSLDYFTLEEVTRAGAKVVQPRAAALARDQGVVLSINAPDGKRGTLIVDRSLTRAVISVITLRPGALMQEVTRLDAPLQEADYFVWTGQNGSYIIIGESGTGIPVDLVTVVGWGGRLPVDAIACSLKTFGRIEREVFAVYRSPGSLTIAIGRGDGTQAIKKLHGAVLEAGLIEQIDVDRPG